MGVFALGFVAAQHAYSGSVSWGLIIASIGSIAAGLVVLRELRQRTTNGSTRTIADR
jgi:hypothetical protein